MRATSATCGGGASTPSNERATSGWWGCGCCCSSVLSAMGASTRSRSLGDPSDLAARGVLARFSSGSTFRGHARRALQVRSAWRMRSPLDGGLLPRAHRCELLPGGILILRYRKKGPSSWEDRTLAITGRDATRSAAETLDFLAVQPVTTSYADLVRSPLVASRV